MLDFDTFLVLSDPSCNFFFFISHCNLCYQQKQQQKSGLIARLSCLITTSLLERGKTDCGPYRLFNCSVRIAIGDTREKSYLYCNFRAKNTI